MKNRVLNLRYQRKVQERKKVLKVLLHLALLALAIVILPFTIVPFGFVGAKVHPVLYIIYTPLLIIEFILVTYVSLYFIRLIYSRFFQAFLVLPTLLILGIHGCYLPMAANWTTAVGFPKLLSHEVINDTMSLYTFRRGAKYSQVKDLRIYALGRPGKFKYWNMLNSEFALGTISSDTMRYYYTDFQRNDSGWSVRHLEYYNYNDSFQVLGPFTLDSLYNLSDSHPATHTLGYSYGEETLNQLKAMVHRADSLEGLRKK